jgi:hypothetical protein
MHLFIVFGTWTDHKIQARLRRLVYFAARSIDPLGINWALNSQFVWMKCFPPIPDGNGNNANIVIVTAHETYFVLNTLSGNLADMSHIKFSCNTYIYLGPLQF